MTGVPWAAVLRFQTSVSGTYTCSSTRTTPSRPSLTSSPQRQDLGQSVFGPTLALVYAVPVQAHPLPIGRLAAYECTEALNASLDHLDPEAATAACPLPRAAGAGRRVPSADADTLPYDVASIEGECDVLPYWLRIGANPPLQPAAHGGRSEEAAAAGGSLDEVPAEHFGARARTMRVGTVDVITLPHLALRSEASAEPATNGSGEQPGIAAMLRNKFLEAISAAAAASGGGLASIASLLQPKPGGGATLPSGTSEQFQAVLQALSQQMGQNLRTSVTVNTNGEMVMGMPERTRQFSARTRTRTHHPVMRSPCVTLRPVLCCPRNRPIGPRVS
jgi:hypothetical protein